MEGKKNHFLLGKDYLVHGLRKLEKRDTPTKTQKTNFGDGEFKRNNYLTKVFLT